MIREANNHQKMGRFQGRYFGTKIMIRIKTQNKNIYKSEQNRINQKDKQNKNCKKIVKQFMANIDMEGVVG